MATKKQRIGAWLVANQDKSDTPEFQKMALAYRVEQAGGVDQYANQRVNERFPQPEQARPEPMMTGSPLGMLAAGAVQNLADAGAGEQLAGYGRDLVSGVTALPRGLMQIGAGAAGDVGALTGVESLESAGYGAKQYLQEDEAARRENMTSMPMRMTGEVLAGGPIGRAVKTVPQAIAFGAGMGAGTAASSDIERGINSAIGGTVGGAIPAISSAARLGGRTVRNLVDPLLPGGNERAVTRALREAAGDRVDDVGRALRENRQVPGGQSGAGEVAAPAGSAEFSALQRMAERGRPSQFAAMASADDAARARMLQDISGTADDRAAAIARRSGRANALYQGRAFQQQISPDNELQGLMNDPYIQKAMKGIDDLAKSKNVDRGSVEYLHLVKKRLEDMIADPQTSGISNTESGQVKQLIRGLSGWLETNVPQYSTAKKVFAQNSKPINRQQVGKALRDALVKPIDDVDSAITSRQRPSSFAQGVRNAPQTIKRATGDSRYKELSDVLSKRQMQSVDDVMGSLNRRAQYERLGAQGMPRASEIVEAPNLPATGPLNQTYMIFKTAVNRLSGKVQGKTLDLLADVMADPQRAAELLERVPPADLPLVQSALQDARTAAIIGAYQGEL